MYLHGAGGSSSDFLSEATALAGRGVASLLITQPEAQEVPGDGNAAVTEIVYEMREMGRAMDLLASRPEVDPSRLGFVGFSFGAVGGATFAGFQSGRLRIAVLASTPPSYDTPAMSPSTRSYGSRTFLRPPSPSRRASWTPGSPTTRARP